MNCEWSILVNNFVRNVFLVMNTSLGHPWHFGVYPCLRLVDADPDSDRDAPVFVMYLKDAIKTKNWTQFVRIITFRAYFFMMIELLEGSGSGSILVTGPSGSGTGRHNNVWIRWTHIRIRNTYKYNRNDLHALEVFSSWVGIILGGCLFLTTAREII
jgi:hypothetical protein